MARHGPKVVVDSVGGAPGAGGSQMNAVPYDGTHRGRRTNPEQVTDRYGVSQLHGQIPRVGLGLGPYLIM